MKKRRRWLRWTLAIASVPIAGFLALVFLAAVADCRQEPPKPSPGVTSLSPGQPKLIFTYFYYWYDLPSGPHSGALTDHPVDPAASYLDVDWMRTQLSDMESAGIDAALAVYWGAEEPSSDVGLQNMVQASSALLAEGHAPPRIGLFLDTGLIGRWPEGERDLRKDENRERVYQLVKTFYTTVPRDQWSLIEGRPVFWLWGSWLNIRFDQGFFDYVSRRFNEDFKTTPYIVADNSWRYAITSGFFGGTKTDNSQPIRIDDFYSWGASITGYRDEGGNIAQIGPGYDERLLGGSSDRTGRVTHRNNGAFYRQSWDAAIASNKRFVAIETWNEFHEASDIADSVEYGRQYIDLTRTYATKFKAPG
jgi:hypothetical protein